MAQYPSNSNNLEQVALKGLIYVIDLMHYFTWMRLAISNGSLHAEFRPLLSPSSIIWYLSIGQWYFLARSGKVTSVAGLVESNGSLVRHLWLSHLCLTDLRDELSWVSSGAGQFRKDPIRFNLIWCTFSLIRFTGALLICYVAHRPLI